MKVLPANARAGRAIELAAAIGDHALAVFGGMLVALLLGVGGGWHAVQRRRARRERPSTPEASRVLIVTFVFGFTVILAVALGLATLPASIAPDGWMTRADQTLTDAIRRTVSRPPLQAFAVVTVLADTWVQWLFAMVGTLVLLWRRERLLACIWIAAIAGNGIVTRVVKTVFERARPLHDDGLIIVQGFSFPSGHASGAVVVYGMLAYVLIRATPVVWHLPIALGATAVAFVVGSSRIFLQVHFASDVAAGFVTGLAWLAVCIVAAESSRRTRGRTP